MKDFKSLISKSRKNVTIAVIMLDPLLSQSDLLNENFVKN